MGLTETGSIDAYRLGRLLGVSTKGRDGRACLSEALSICRGRHEYLRQVDDADRDNFASLSTCGEEPARRCVVRVRGVESKNQNLGIDDDHRSASSASGRAR